MRVSISWLREYIDITDQSTESIAQHLTNLGLEVEQVESVSPVDDKVVVGVIRSAKPHPNADGLQLCDVEVGGPVPLGIVCGAPNARPGIHVAVATLGANLPGGLTIKASKIRGEPSAGMLCSGHELGLSADDDGIMELDKSLKNPTLGQPLGQALGLGDTVLTLNVTPNRADCLSHLGVARDLAAKLGKKLRDPIRQPSRKFEPVATGPCKVEVEQGCRRFVAMTIENIPKAPSPAWLCRRLEAAGMRSLGLLIDLSNYLMLETGQPNHAYDLRDISGSTLRVVAAKKGDLITTLDGQQQELQGGDLLIRDKERAVGLAGVMGGANSEVKGDTSSIVLEVAHFDPKSVRSTARRLGLHSEASKRFERGIDIEVLPEIAWRYFELLQQCGREAFGDSQGHLPKVTGLVDHYPEPVRPARIALRVNRARRILGLYTLNQDRCLRHLEALHFKILDRTEERILVEAPAWRVDMEREVDLIEEIGRLEGFEHIPYALPQMDILPTAEDPFITFVESLRVSSAQQGLCEVVTFPFTSGALIESLGIPKGHPLFPSLSLRNPLAEEQRYMRTTLIGSLLEACRTNRNHGRTGVRLFEVGRGYFDFSKGQGKTAPSSYWNSIGRLGRHLTPKAKEEKNRPTERHWLGGILDQPFVEKTWYDVGRPATFFQGKAHVQRILSSLGLTAKYKPIQADDFPFLHPGCSAVVIANDQSIGVVGEIHPLVAQRLDLGTEQSPVFFEIDLEYLYEATTKEPQYDTRLWRFPGTKRDLAFVCDQERTVDEFHDSFSGFPQRQFLQRFQLFDIYTGDHVGPGKQSLAFTCEFRSPDRTLTDKDVDTEIQHLVQWISQKTGSALRG